jgi:fructose-bisphosphate aldolase class II
MAVYQEIGFVDPRELLHKALEGGYVVPAYNFVIVEQAEAILEACLATRSPVILQVSANARKYFHRSILRHLCRGLMAMVEDSGNPIPVALNLDHGGSLAECQAAIEDGFSAVMIDGSALPLEGNAELTRRVVEYAHGYGVCVEGELGALAGVEEGTGDVDPSYTDPNQAWQFVRDTGVDCLAVSVGNVHGLRKVVRCRAESSIQPELRFDIIEQLGRRLPQLPLVLHGSSTLPRQYIETINHYGGNLEQALGIPENQIREAVRTNICKINVASDGFMVVTAAVRKVLSEEPSVIDPRRYLGAARKELIELYMDKNVRLFGSAGRT